MMMPRCLLIVGLVLLGCGCSSPTDAPPRAEDTLAAQLLQPDPAPSWAVRVDEVVWSADGATGPRMRGGHRFDLETVSEGGRAYHVVPVFFGTSRMPDASGTSYGFARSEALRLGVAEVAIPSVHQRGQLEAPGWMSSASPYLHVVLQSVEELPAERFVDRAREWVGQTRQAEVLIYVHGFNVTFDDAARRAAQLWWDLEVDAVPMMYSWPSRGTSAPADYIRDRNDAEWAVTDFLRFLELVRQQAGAERVHVIAHSTGGWLLAHALATLDIAERRSPVVTNAIFAAADIDTQSFLRLSQSLPQTAEHVTLYASAYDRALQCSQQLHGYARLGQGGDHLLSLDAPWCDAIDASPVTSYLFALNHSYYAQSDSLLDDLRFLIRDRVPASERPRLVPSDEPANPFYVLQPAPE